MKISLLPSFCSAVIACRMPVSEGIYQPIGLDPRGLQSRPFPDCSRTRGEPPAIAHTTARIIAC